MTVTLVLGGVRSGKSDLARTEAEAATRAAGTGAVMIATAQAFDDEMAARIARHRAERGPLWRTVEAPVALADAIAAVPPGTPAVVDCLTLWLSNLMAADLPVEAAADGLVAAVGRAPGPLWLVSNEVGLGIVPDNALARRFRDEAGRLHRRLAQAADKVIMTVAGLPLVLKS